MQSFSIQTRGETTRGYRVGRWHRNAHVSKRARRQTTSTGSPHTRGHAGAQAPGKLDPSGSLALPPPSCTPASLHCAARPARAPPASLVSSVAPAQAASWTPCRDRDVGQPRAWLRLRGACLLAPSPINPGATARARVAMALTAAAQHGHATGPHESTCAFDQAEHMWLRIAASQSKTNAHGDEKKRLKQLHNDPEPGG